MMSHRAFRVRALVLLLAGLLVAALSGAVLQTDEEEETQTGGEAPTKYYLLMAPFRFTPTQLGGTPEVEAYGGGPWWLPLEECEVTAKGAQRASLVGHHPTYVTQVHEGGLLKEVAISCGGVLCYRYVFRYDDDGRLAGRTDTEYDFRRKGEDTEQWVKRMKGKTPVVARVSVIAYLWSGGSRTVEVKMVSRQGERAELGLTEAPSIPYGTPGTVLETWTLDSNGRVVEVLSRGTTRYSATYDEAGRLLMQKEAGEETQHTYDAQVRLAKTAFQGPARDGTVLYGYPDAPAPKPPAVPVSPKDDSLYIVTRDQAGHIASVDVREPTGDMTGVFTVVLERDARGRLKSMRLRMMGFPVPFFEE